MIYKEGRAREEEGEIMVIVLDYKKGTWKYTK
jgi:hypothetical protein